jgi:hypothetical protein
MKARREAQAAAEGGSKPDSKDDAAPADILAADEDEDVIF